MLSAIRCRAPSRRSPRKSGKPATSGRTTTTRRSVTLTPAGCSTRWSACCARPGAVTEAGEVDKLLFDHQRAAFEKETKRAVRQSAALPAVEGMGLKPWREVLRRIRTSHRPVQRLGVRGGPVQGRARGGRRRVRRAGGVLPAHLPDRGPAGPDRAARCGGCPAMRTPRR